MRKEGKSNRKGREMRPRLGQFKRMKGGFCSLLGPFGGGEGGRATSKGRRTLAAIGGKASPCCESNSSLLGKRTEEKKRPRLVRKKKKKFQIAKGESSWDIQKKRERGRTTVWEQGGIIFFWGKKEKKEGVYCLGEGKGGGREPPVEEESATY